MFKKLIQKEIAEYITSIQPIAEERIATSFETLQELELTDGEKQTLTKYGNSKILSTILEKYLFALSARSLSSRSVEDIAEIRGGVKTIQFIMQELTKYKPAEKVNRLTGEYIK